jgi:hypothetical protein
MRVLHMRHKADARGPEARVVGHARDALARRHRRLRLLAQRAVDLETLTPTFSKTRPPRITLISPPPASPPSSEARLVSVTSNRPGSASAKRALGLAVLERLEGRDDVVAQVRNQAAARVFRSVDHLVHRVGPSVIWIPRLR